MLEGRLARRLALVVYVHIYVCLSRPVASAKLGIRRVLREALRVGSCGSPAAAMWRGW